MPMIRIITDSEKPDINLEKAVTQISAEMGMESSRLNLMLEAYEADTFYRGCGGRFPIIQISARRHNGVEWIQRLMSASAKAVAGQLSLRSEDVTVITHYIEDGLLLDKGSFV
ncbi:MAG: hypothetical protein VB064_07105 [Oscillospiraceae bacterium]|nr:hypothetical protein [Oscillospiraceae bacterium]